MLRAAVGASTTLLLGLGACHSSPASTKEPAVAATNAVPHSETVRAIEALGDDGVMMVVLRPDSWDSMWNEGPTSDFLGSVPKIVEGFTMIQLDPRPPVGWDSTEAIVISVDEVPYGGPSGTVTTRSGWLEGRLSMTRSQVWLPATDPEQLIANLSVQVEGTAPFPGVDMGVDSSGTRTVEYLDRKLVMVPEERAVRLVVFKALPVVPLPNPPGGEEGKENLAELFDVGNANGYAVEHGHPSARDGLRMDISRHDAPLTPGPTTAALLDPNHQFALRLRPWRLRARNVATALESGQGVVPTVDEVNRPKSRVLIASIALEAEALMSDAGTELGEIAFGGSFGPEGPRGQGTMALTARGDAIMRAATRTVTEPLALRRPEDVAFSAVIRADLRSTIEAAVIPEGLSSSDLVRSLGAQLAELDSFQRGFLWTSHPVGMLRTLDRGERIPWSTGGLPTALHLAVTRPDAEGSMQGALAVHWPSDHDEESMRLMLPVFRGVRGLEALEFDVQQREDEQITVFEVDSAEGWFDSDQRAMGDAIAEGWVDLGAFAPRVGGGKSSWSVTYDDNVLHARSAPTGEEPETALAPVTEPFTVPSQEFAESEGGRCLTAMTRALAQGLELVANSAEGNEARMARSSMSSAVTGYDCAIQHEASADAARGQWHLAATLIADAIATTDPNAALRFVRDACTRIRDDECSLAATYATTDD